MEEEEIVSEVGAGAGAGAETQHKALWITSCIVGKDGIEITNLYGEFFCRWKEIVFATAGELRKKGEEATFLLGIVLHEVQDVYYIDGKKINPRLFVFKDAIDQKAMDRDLQVLWEAVRKADYQGSFKWLCERLCSYLVQSYKDGPLVKLLGEGSFELPVYSSHADFASYCFHAFESLSDEDKDMGDVEEFSDEELKAVSAPSTERAEWKQGEVIENRYIIEALHRGGMGLVYEAFDPETIRYYALKTFQEQFLWDEKVVQLFVKEAEIWVKLGKHPNIVTAELVKIIDGKPYIFLEFITGTDLEKLIEEKELGPKEALEYAIQFCNGMDYAFKEIGLIHRDIKPSNCLINRDGIVKITDFGLGKVLEGISGKDDGDLKAIGELKASAPSHATSIVGTLPFMAPELFCETAGASRKTDIYSFGLMLSLMLSGKNPMYNNDPGRIIDNHLSFVPENLHVTHEHIPPELGDIVLKCIKKEPEQRYSSFEEIKNALNGVYEQLYGLPYKLPEARDEFTEAEWLNRGMSLVFLGRHGEALLAFDKALELNRCSSQALTHKGASLIHLGRLDEAIALLDESLLYDGASWQSWYHKGEALRRRGALRDALIALEMALELSSFNPEMRAHKGKILMEMGHFEKARSCFREALEGNPRLDGIWHDQGRLLLLMMLYEESQESFSTAIEINPRNARAWLGRGDALAKLGHYSEAVKAYQKALSLDKKLTDAQVGIGNTYRDMGNSQRALLSYNTMIAKGSASGKGHYEKALLYVKDGQWEKALETLDEGDKAGLRSIELRALKGRVLLELGYFDEVLELFKNASHEGDAAFQKEVAQLWLDEKKRVIEDITSVESLPPEKIFNDLETVLAVFCDPADGAYQLAGYVKERRDLKLWNILAALFMLAGKWEESRKAVAISLSIDSESPEAQYLERKIKNYSSLSSVDSGELPGSADESPKSGGGSLFKTMAQKGYQSIAGIVKQQMVYMVLGMDNKSAQSGEKSDDSGLFGAIPLDEEKGEEKKRKKLEHTYLDWLFMAFREMQQGNHLKAVNLHEKVVRINQRLHAQLYFLARCFENLQHNDNARQYYEKFISGFPYSSGYYKDKALAAEPRKTPPSEIEGYYKRWIGLYPRNITAWIAYIRCLSETGHCDRVRLMAHHLITTFSEEDFLLQEPQRGLNIRGVLLLILGRLTQARSCFSRVLGEGGHESTAMLGEARAHVGLKHPAKAKEIYEKLRNDPRGALTALYSFGDLLLQEGNFIGALRPLEEAFIRRKVSILLSFKRAEILVKRKKFVEFFLVFTEMRQLDEQFFPLRQLRSLALAETGKIDEALEDLEDAWKFRPENPVVIKWLALFYINRNMASKAITIVDDAIRLHSFDRAIHMLRGIALFQLGNYREALKSFKVSLSIDQENPELLLYMAATCFFNDDKSAAEDYFYRLEEGTARYIPLWVNRGVFYYKQERYAEALQFFRGALRLDAENLSAWLKRGYCELAMEQYDGAARTAEKMLILAPGCRDAWILKAAVDEALNDLTGAIESLQKANSIQEGGAPEYYNIGLLHLLNDDPTQAATAFDRAMHKNRDFFDAALGMAHAVNDESVLEDEDERYSTDAHRYLKMARSFDPERYEEWEELSAECDNPVESLKPLELLPVSFEFPLTTLSKVFQPLQLIHLLDLDTMFY